MKPRRATPPIGGAGFLIRPLLLLLLQLLLLGPRCTGAQPPPPSNSSGGGNNNVLYPYGYKKTNFSPSMAIVIVVLISAFFFIVFFSVYMRQCGGGDSVGRLAAVSAATAARSRRQRGLVPEVLATFPTLFYSEVKGLKIGKGVLECAVCLSEFEDDETLRLLPPCSHVFHPDCIDAWLTFHVTCPVCRCNLAGPDHADSPASPGPAGPETPAAVDNSEVLVRAAGEGEQEELGPVLDEVPPDHVAIAVDEGASGDRKTELEELAELSRIASRRRAVGSRSRARPPRFPRSYSTGHSPVPAHQAENLDRFTLRLPEDIRREIVAAGRLQRATSLRAFPVGLERSTRRGYRGVDGSFRAGRSIRLGRSGHWSAFFGRNFSARFPAWALGKRWDEEGSVKKGEGWDGSTRGKLPSVRAQFDCLGSGGAKLDSTAGDDESCTTRPRV